MPPTTRSMTRNGGLQGWLAWVDGRTNAPPADEQKSKAYDVLEHIGEAMDKEKVPYEIRLSIFGHVLRNKPAVDISRGVQPPLWATGDLERIWYENTKFVFACPKIGQIEPGHDVKLNRSTIDFIGKLCARRHVRPLTFEVAILLNGDFYESEISFAKLLLISHHLGDRRDLLDIKFAIINFKNQREEFEPPAEVKDALEEHLLKHCTTMQKLKDGTMSIGQAFQSVDMIFDPELPQQFRPENLVARILARETAEADLWGCGWLGRQKEFLALRMRLAMGKHLKMI